MDELLARHRKEQRDLQSQITQKKKSASKKTRKTVNDECAKLEDDLKARHQEELRFGAGTGDGDAVPSADAAAPSLRDGDDHDDILDAIVGGSSRATTGQDGDSIAQQTRKPNRQKARLARRAAEQEAVAEQAARESTSMPDLKARERARMLEEFERRGLREKEVAANGHCLYSAVADQMRQLGLPLNPELKTEPGDTRKGEVQREDYKIVRGAAAGYMSSNADDFAPFLEEPLDEYLHKVKDTGEWGGQLELLALAKTYGININVIQGDGRVEKIEGGSTTPAQDVWLAYYRHGFGLGEHYNSLRRAEPAASTV